MALNDFGVRFPLRKSVKLIRGPNSLFSLGGVIRKTDRMIKPITEQMTRVAINMPFQLRSLPEVATNSCEIKKAGKSYYIKLLYHTACNTECYTVYPVSKIAKKHVHARTKDNSHLHYDTNLLRNEIKAKILFFCMGSFFFTSYSNFNFKFLHLKVLQMQYSLLYL